MANTNTTAPEPTLADKERDLFVYWQHVRLPLLEVARRGTLTMGGYRLVLKKRDAESGV